jgi:CRISPR-associated protein Cmr5
MPTREQKRAQEAYGAVILHHDKPDEIDYKRFSKSFPSLIQACGLAQSIAYAMAKSHVAYIEDLARVAGFTDADEMARQSRGAAVSLYQRYSREALASATWIKRYAEALLKDDQ